MPEIDYPTILRHYKKKWIQEELLLTGKGREVAIKFDYGFGKRPDSLFYPRDIFEHAKQKASSFHISEERWSNPLNLSTSLKKRELDELRVGWDLVIDIDFPQWDACKLIAHEVVQALKEHDITNISAKFSGNKGFHIGVPYESFPDMMNDKPLSVLFPDGVKRIVEYLIHYMDNEENDFILSNKIQKYTTVEKKEEKKSEYTYHCTRCGHTVKKEAFYEHINCEECHYPIEPDAQKPQKKESKQISLDIDTMLITQRHLYRSVFSLHEKSGLCSVPINPDKILDFKKEEADPEKLPVERTHHFLQYRFLDGRKATENEARKLLIAALDWKPKIEEEKEKPIYLDDLKGETIPKECFPPAIIDLFKGLEDGRKRALFILMNFLRSVNWAVPDIEKELYEWNERNPEPLRESYLKGQLSQLRKQRQIMLPPNYDNAMYYTDLKVGTEEERRRDKNPVAHAKRRYKMAKQINSRKKKKKEDETTPVVQSVRKTQGPDQKESQRDAGDR